MDKRYPVTAAFMEFYSNVAANLLKQSPQSQAKIGFLAYSNMTIPPVGKLVAAKPLVAYLAPSDFDPIHGMDDPKSPPRGEYRDMLYKWAQVMEGRLAVYDDDQGMLVWRDIPNPSTDLYIQAQGVRAPDQQSHTGHGWYQTEITLKPEQVAGKLHLLFPGLFNECWLYVNGQPVAERKFAGPIWWLNDYKSEWDVELTGKLKPGANTLALRLYNPHHFGGMFRRPFLYTAK